MFRSALPATNVSRSSGSSLVISYPWNFGVVVEVFIQRNALTMTIIERGWKVIWTSSLVELCPFTNPAWGLRQPKRI